MNFALQLVVMVKYDALTIGGFRYHGRNGRIFKTHRGDYEKKWIIGGLLSFTKICRTTVKDSPDLRSQQISLNFTKYYKPKNIGQ
jgi:hypothetical protein